MPVLFEHTVLMQKGDLRMRVNVNRVNRYKDRGWSIVAATDRHGGIEVPGTKTAEELMDEEDDTEEA